MTTGPPALQAGRGLDAMTRLYHRTTSDKAAAILSEGFREETSVVRYGFHAGEGVFFSLWAPADEQMGPSGGAVLVLDLPTAVAAQFFVWEHWEELGGWVLYEAMVPAYVANRNGPPRLVETDPEWERLLRVLAP